MILRLRGHGPFIGPFLLWAVLAIVFAGGMSLFNLSSIFAHNSTDQNTRQAAQWLEGKISVGPLPPPLESASHGGKIHSSFPPVPAIFEVPWVIAFGENTPNHLSLLLWALLGAWVLFEMGLRADWSPLESGFISFCFMTGTSLLPTTIQSGSQAQCQIIGFVLATAAIGFIFRNRGTGKFRPWIGYFLLALAVGCRPIYLLYFPLLMILDLKLGRPLQAGKIVDDFLYASVPFLILLATYNLVRFGNPIQFGQTLTPRYGELPYGVFSLNYFAQNLTRAIIRIPSVTTSPWSFGFEKEGNAAWLNNPVLVFSLAITLLRPVSKLLRITWLATLIAVSFALLIQAPSTSAQFGYERIIDVLPLAFTGFLIAASKRDLLLLDWIPLSAYSLMVNLYAVYWIRTHA